MASGSISELSFSSKKKRVNLFPFSFIFTFNNNSTLFLFLYFLNPWVVKIWFFLKPHLEFYCMFFFC
jgi:hypothetical protein